MSRHPGTDAPADEASVAAYLKAHPDFLHRHPEVLAKLMPPSRYDDDLISDLQVSIIARLRQELDEMRGCAEHLISTTRSNMSTQTRTHEAVLAILGAQSMADLARAVAEDLPPLLDVDVAGLAFDLGDEALPALTIAAIARPPADTTARLLGERAVLLKSAGAGEPELFGHAAALVQSAAMVRLTVPGCPPGLLLLGSRAERTFHPGQATDLLGFLGHVVEHGVRRWLTA